ncbi:hypothetical protein [Ancylobacter sp.]|uniref:hypothetical protein n=1 Tax=Ancylobacter sp. TaxID=1872567 RepID=UPI003D0F4AA1
MDQCRGGLVCGDRYIYSSVTHADIAGFQACAGVQFRPWERRALLAMDRARLAWLNKRDDKATDKPKDDDLTPEMFDALFG